MLYSFGRTAHCTFPNCRGGSFSFGYLAERSRDLGRTCEILRSADPGSCRVVEFISTCDLQMVWSPFCCDNEVIFCLWNIGFSQLHKHTHLLSFCLSLSPSHTHTASFSLTYTSFSLKLLPPTQSFFLSLSPPVSVGCRTFVLKKKKKHQENMFFYCKPDLNLYEAQLFSYKFPWECPKFYRATRAEVILWMIYNHGGPAWFNSEAHHRHRDLIKPPCNPSVIISTSAALLDGSLVITSSELFFRRAPNQRVMWQGIKDTNF